MMKIQSNLRPLKGPTKCGLLRQVVSQHRWITLKNALLGVWKGGLLTQVTSLTVHCNAILHTINNERVHLQQAFFRIPQFIWLCILSSKEKDRELCRVYFLLLDFMIDVYVSLYGNPPTQFLSVTSHSNCITKKTRWDQIRKVTIYTCVFVNNNIFIAWPVFRFFCIDICWLICVIWTHPKSFYSPIPISQKR